MNPDAWCRGRGELGALGPGVIRPLFLGACLFLGLAAAGCVRDSIPPPPRGETERVPQQVMHGVHLRQTSARGLLWVLRADEGWIYGPDEPTQMTNLNVAFYDGKNQVRSTLTSKKGEVDDRNQSLVARDSVVVVTPQGERLETDNLRWDPKRERITTADPFVFVRGPDRLTGVGFEADPDLTHYSVQGQVRAEVRSEEDQKIMEALDGDTARGGRSTGH